MPRTAGARHHALGQADGCDFVRMCVRVDGRYWLEADSDLLCCHAGPRDLHRTHLVYDERADVIWEGFPSGIGLLFLTWVVSHTLVV